MEDCFALAAFRNALIKWVDDRSVFANLANKPFGLAQLAVLPDVLLPPVVRFLQHGEQIALLNVVQVVQAVHVGGLAQVLPVWQRRHQLVTLVCYPAAHEELVHASELDTRLPDLGHLLDMLE